MTIELIVIGKTDSKEIAALVELYARRVNHYCRFAVTALPDVRNTKSMTVRQQRTAEGEAILRQLTDGDYVTLLDEQVDANAALAWCCFIGSAPMVRSNEHFKFTALTEKLKGKSLFADELAGHIFVLIFNLVVGIYGIKLVQQFAAWKMTSMPVSKGWSWLCVPIFGLTAAVFSVENIIDCIKHPDRGQVEDAVEKAMKEAEL